METDWKNGKHRSVHCRCGISLYIVVASLLLASIFAFTTHRLAVEALARTRHLGYVQAAYRLARSAIAGAIASIEDGIADQSSPLYHALVDGNPCPGTVLPIDVRPIDSLAKDQPQGGISVNVRLQSTLPLDSNHFVAGMIGADPGEKRCFLEIEAVATVNGYEMRLSELREMRVVHLMPGILGKFTLFVAHPDTNAGAYNRYANDINGWSDDRGSNTGKSLPVVLKNGGELDEATAENESPDSYLQRGFVYFGGGETTLSLTAGNGNTTTQ
ncbi:MAG: hypothetical protein HQM09_16255 [Candidatus Riflebacteria bacterium]|nr:hypothetical protein [Candidatus Riflebacteria bacterium]